MSNPKSPNHRCTYDAFLSFRGTDTRKGFTDHLYRALEVAGIHTFRDDDEIERGANISAELQKAIQESRVSIIVFSKDYASSRWCLDELVTIMDRRETNEHMVMPIFYDVDPSHVRNQTGIFEESFARHQQRFNKEMDKVEKWRKALRDVADLGGMVLGDRSESQFIQEIVEVIGNKLDHTWNRRLRVDAYVVGIDYRVKGLNMWLEDGSTDVGVAVVCGMGGIGKTTIAKTAYNQNFNKFQGSSFLADIRATSKLPNGLVHLQRNLLSDLQKGKAKKIYNLDGGITKIKRAIRCKRVLIALDDVDNLEQFNAILGMREWLHPGSKIIITTRHEHLLKAHENCAIFKVEGLHEYESLELFSWHAFRQPQPGDGYMYLSRPVVQHCGGVPLALQVLGSSLFGKAVDVWKNALRNLDVITEGKIQKILRISFDSLQDHDKRLFLHIACFFIGKDKDLSTTVLDECEFATNIGIQNLVDRCLLIIDGFNKLTMHQLLQDMGRGIIREESPEDPGKRTRVWNKDASNVLRKLTGTETIKGLMLNIPMLIKDESSKIISSGSNRKRFRVEDYDGNCSSSRRRLGFFSWQSISSSSTNSFPVSNEIGFKTEAFRRMHNLELLVLDNVKISGGYEDFPKNLIWLSWRGFALKSIPTNFYLENLIALDLRNSSLQHVWKGTKGLDECGIFSIFLLGSEVPDWFCHKSSMGDSELSITIPPHRNLKIRGLNACVVYSRDERWRFRFFSGVPILHISNETKGLKWSYVPVTIGVPKEKEQMLWLSHWRFANDELEGGDEIRVSVDLIRSSVRDKFHMLTKEFGIQVVYEENNNEGSVTEDITTVFQHEITTPSSQNQVVVGDVSASASRFHKNNKNKVGEYFICNHRTSPFL